MSVNVPLVEGTDAAGGYVVPDAVGQLIYKGLLETSGVLAMPGVDVDRIDTKKEVIPVMSEFPAAYFVGETAAIPTSGATFANFTVNVKKLAVIVPISNELIADASISITDEVTSKISAAFAKLIDQHAIGIGVTGSFDCELVSTSLAAELDETAPDALRLAVSEAMEDVELNGYEPNGALLAVGFKRHVRDARKAVETADPLYGSLADPLYGLGSGFSQHLDNPGTPGSGKVVGLVGDWRNLKVRVRADLEMKPSSEATVNGVSMYETDQTAMRWIMRVGLNAYDLSRAFCKITNATDEAA